MVAEIGIGTAPPSVSDDAAFRDHASGIGLVAGAVTVIAKRPSADTRTCMVAATDPASVRAIISADVDRSDTVVVGRTVVVFLVGLTGFAPLRVVVTFGDVVVAVWAEASVIRTRLADPTAKVVAFGCTCPSSAVVVQVATYDPERSAGSVTFTDSSTVVGDGVRQLKSDGPCRRISERAAEIGSP